MRSEVVASIVQVGVALERGSCLPDSFVWGPWRVTRDDAPGAPPVSVWYAQPARNELTLHMDACRHLKPDAIPTPWLPADHAQHVIWDGAPRSLWTCRACIKRARALVLATAPNPG